MTLTHDEAVNSLTITILTDEPNNTWGVRCTACSATIAIALPHDRLEDLWKRARLHHTRCPNLYAPRETK